MPAFRNSTQRLVGTMASANTPGTILIPAVTPINAPENLQRISESKRTAAIKIRLTCPRSSVVVVGSNIAPNPNRPAVARAVLHGSDDPSVVDRLTAVSHEHSRRLASPSTDHQRLRNAERNGGEGNEDKRAERRVREWQIANDVSQFVEGLPVEDPLAAHPIDAQIDEIVAQTHSRRRLRERQGQAIRARPATSRSHGRTLIPTPSSRPDEALSGGSARTARAYRRSHGRRAGSRPTGCATSAGPARDADACRGPDAISSRFAGHR